MYKSLEKVAIGKQAPDFVGVSYYKKGFRKIQLSDYRGKYVLLFFYPYNFTNVSQTEILAFNEIAQQLKKIGCEIIGCSVDSKYGHMSYCKQTKDKGGVGELNIPLISDLNREICKDYGVLIEDGPEINVALRGTFLIDKDGILRHYYINDVQVGRNIDEFKRIVQAFIIADEYGEHCTSSDVIKQKPNDPKTEVYWKEVHDKN